MPMRNLLFFLLFIVACSAPGENTKTPIDLSTDEKVMAELNKGRKEPLEEGEVCIERPEEFKDLILIGYFADDRGCMLGDAFYKGEKIDIEKSSSKILMDNGWAERKNKADLALEWVVNVSALWETVVSEEPDNFDTTGEHIFSAPEIQLLDNGSVIIKCWIKEPSGMAPEDEYYKLLVEFSDKGEIIRSEAEDRYTEILP